MPGIIDQEKLMPYILALDEGTTSARAIVFDHDGSVCAVAQKEIKQIYPRPGWVEHDPHEIWTCQMGVAVEALEQARLKPADVVAIGITNQRETTVVWIAIPAKPSTTPSSGRIAGRPRCATSYGRRAERSSFKSGPA